MGEMEKNILSEAEDEITTGGMLLDTYQTPEYDASFRYAAVNNDNGQIMAKFKTPQDAEQYANSFGTDNSYNAQWVNWGTVDMLQKNPHAPQQ